MINLIPAENLHYSDFGWLKTHWLFSFGSYHDKDNEQFGGLFVYNDDIVEPHTGFDTHPHREMEIVTIVLSGEMEHEDTMGNRLLIKAGDVQRMSAGTGLMHAERNRSGEPVHFHQIWILPDTPGLQPSYAQESFQPEQWEGKLAVLASSNPQQGQVGLNTDAVIYRCLLHRERPITLENAKERCLFIYCLSGSLQVNGLAMNIRDQARIKDEGMVRLHTDIAAQCILIDVPDAA
jgi:redox-sensitive bicupin YhaK (pirin superfamily)